MCTLKSGTAKATSGHHITQKEVLSASKKAENLNQRHGPRTKNEREKQQRERNEKAN